MDYDHVDNLLHEAGISRRELARRCNIAPGTMSNWYKRKTKNVPMKHVLAMATVLQVPWNEIMGLDEVAEGLYAKLPCADEVNDNSDVEIPVYDSEGNFLYIASFTSGRIPTQKEAQLIGTFQKLNESGQEKVIDYADTLSKVPEYQIK